MHDMMAYSSIHVVADYSVGVGSVSSTGVVMQSLSTEECRVIVLIIITKDVLIIINTNFSVHASAVLITTGPIQTIFTIQ